MLKFYPDTVSLSVIRSITKGIGAPLTGGGIVYSFSGFLGTDENGNAILMIFRVY